MAQEASTGRDALPSHHTTPHHNAAHQITPQHTTIHNTAPHHNAAHHITPHFTTTRRNTRHDINTPSRPRPPGAPGTPDPPPPPQASSGLQGWSGGGHGPGGLVASHPGVVLHLVFNGYFMAVVHPVLHPVLQGDAVYPPGCSADGGAPWPGGAHALVILCNILIPYRALAYLLP